MIMIKKPHDSLGNGNYLDPYSRVSGFGLVGLTV